MGWAKVGSARTFAPLMRMCGLRPNEAFLTRAAMPAAWTRPCSKAWTRACSKVLQRRGVRRVELSPCAWGPKTADTGLHFSCRRSSSLMRIDEDLRLTHQRLPRARRIAITA